MNNKDILVIHPYLKINRITKDYCLEEAINLVKAIGLNCIKSYSVGLDEVSPKTFIKIGYIKKLKNSLAELKIDLVLLNVNLSPIQQRNLENQLNCKFLIELVLY